MFFTSIHGKGGAGALITIKVENRLDLALYLYASQYGLSVNKSLVVRMRQPLPFP